MNSRNNQSPLSFRPRPGFTLIELLIVVAIIAILAAIAVPNFLEAQTRSKISRVHNDHRAYVTAVEAYRIDNGRYPYSKAGQLLRYVYEITTPIAYMASLAQQDPFDPQGGGQREGSYHYMYYKSPGFFRPGSNNSTGPYQGRYVDLAHLWWRTPEGAPELAMLGSLGPNREHNAVGLAPIHWDRGEFFAWANRQYDPTNGTISFGDIGRFTGQTPGGMPSTLIR